MPVLGWCACRAWPRHGSSLASCMTRRSSWRLPCRTRMKSGSKRNSRRGEALRSPRVSSRLRMLRNRGWYPACCTRARQRSSRWGRWAATPRSQPCAWRGIRRRVTAGLSPTVMTPVAIAMRMRRSLTRGCATRCARRSGPIWMSRARVPGVRRLPSTTACRMSLPNVCQRCLQVRGRTGLPW